MGNKGRKKRSLINIVLALISQLSTVIVGMLLPRALMVNYGSETNGLITSLQQIISYLTLIEGGLLSTVAVALYKPLAEENTDRVNQVLASAKYFYRKTGIVFCVVLLFFAITYPLTIAKTEYSYVQIFLMVLLIGVNGATQILFIGKYKALLMASQRNGIILAINAISTVLYSALLILGAYVHLPLIVGLGIAVCAYLVRAIMFYVVVRKKLPQYCYNKKSELVLFPQRGDAFASQILTMLSLNGGVIVLSVMKAPMGQISVYTTYNLVLSGLYMLMYSIENSVTSALGDLAAKESIQHIRSSYHKFDSAYHLIWAIVVGCLAVLLIPFIKVYTIGVEDANYIIPIEACLFILIGSLWMLRNQETLLMTARGRFKDMRKPMTIEAIIVIVGGALLYSIWGMRGMLIAKVLSVLYMTIVLMRYTYVILLQETMIPKIKNIGVSLIAICLTFAIGYWIRGFFSIDGLIGWIYYALACGMIAVVSTSIIGILFKNSFLNQSMPRPKEH